MKNNNLLKNLKIASPCSANWEEMFGTDQERYCGQCKLNVYNLSEMSKKEAEDFLLNAEGGLCGRFYQRSDGTVLTQDCPLGWKNVKRRISRFAAAFASMAFCIIGGLGINSAFIQLFSNEKILEQKLHLNGALKGTEHEYIPPSFRRLSPIERKKLRQKFKSLLYLIDRDKRAFTGKIQPLKISLKDTDWNSQKER